MKRKLKILSLCDGLSGGRIAFKKLKITVEYHAVEIKKSSRQLSDDNFSNNIRWKNDVYDITLKDVKKHGPFDWVIMGPICKSVSNASNGDGLKGSSGILYQCLKIRDWVLKTNPKAKYLIENVKMKDIFYSQFCELIGHEGVLINSALVSGQERLRYYWTNFELGLPKDRNIFLNDVLEPDAKYAKAWSKSSRYIDVNGKVWSAPGPGRKYFKEERYKVTNKANTLMASKHCKGQSTETRVFKTKNKYRLLTLRECARLQTIPETFSFKSVSINQAFEAVGDGWTVDVIKHILKSGIK